MFISYSIGLEFIASGLKYSLGLHLYPWGANPYFLDSNAINKLHACNCFVSIHCCVSFLFPPLSFAREVRLSPGPSIDSMPAEFVCQQFLIWDSFGLGLLNFKEGQQGRPKCI